MKYFQIVVSCLVGEGDDIASKKLTYLIKDNGVEAALLTFTAEVMPNLNNPVIKSISDTTISEIVNYDNDEEITSVFKAKVAYIVDHPTKNGKEKTIFEYAIVFSDSSQNAFLSLNDHLKNSIVSGEYRIDSVSLISLEDVINSNT